MRQRWNVGAGLLQLDLQREDVVLGGGAERETPSRNAELFFLRCQNGNLISPSPYRYVRPQQLPERRVSAHGFQSSTP
jgi:hypothetical protein